MSSHSKALISEPVVEFHGSVLRCTTTHSVTYWWKLWFLCVLTISLFPILLLFGLVWENGLSAFAYLTNSIDSHTLVLPMVLDLRLLGSNLITPPPPVYAFSITPNSLAGAILLFYLYIFLFVFLLAWCVLPEFFVFDQLLPRTTRYYRDRSHISNLRQDKFRRLLLKDISPLYVRLNDRSSSSNERHSIPLDISENITCGDVLAALCWQHLLPLDYLNSHYLVAPGRWGKPIHQRKRLGDLCLPRDSNLSLRLRIQGGMSHAGGSEEQEPCPAVKLKRVQRKEVDEADIIQHKLAKGKARAELHLVDAELADVPHRNIVLKTLSMLQDPLPIGLGLQRLA
ncbi:hypothetical protein JAAARDRAFT_198622 [Jaapia argillacea MUCL 33604]|uniref:Uncharacterized protein n=1 Tax=Jaapia argillacea MUCL 33604 TaxID=933084 RepID=A0A067PB56_9AGAM|nr:hypothetical protein JAAARDRAFT_198622 [Jaapia argillacea MUCL 33604]